MRLIDEDRHENLSHALEAALEQYVAGVNAFNTEVEAALRGFEGKIRTLFAEHVEGPRDTYEAVAVQACAFAASTADALEDDGVDADIVADWREAVPMLHPWMQGKVDLDLDLVAVEEALDPVERHLWQLTFHRGRPSGRCSTLRLTVEPQLWDHWHLLIEKE